MIKIDKFLNSIDTNEDIFANNNTLHEGPYDLPNIDGNDSDSNDDSENNTSKSDDNDSDNKYSLPDENEENSDISDDEIPDDNNIDDDKLSNTEEESEDDGSDVLDNQNEQDNTEESTDNGVPEIKILNLSEKDKQLNNLKLFRKFKDLQQDAKTLSENLEIDGLNPRQRQINDIVASNLISLLEDLTNVMQYKYSDVYETNMTIYLSLLKRYQLAKNILQNNKPE